MSSLKHDLPPNKRRRTDTAIIDKTKPLTKPKIDRISQELINKICSYLNLKSYTIFERCNRTIFTAARSPVQLHHIDGLYILLYIMNCNKNKQIVDKKRFRRLKSLIITQHLGVSKLFKNSLIFTDLQCLSIIFHEEDILHEIMQSKNIQLTNLKKLILINYASSSSILNHDQINNILQKPSNLKFLDLKYNHPLKLCAKSQHIIKNLSGLALRCDDDWYASRDVTLENNMLNACSLELRSFHTLSKLASLNLSDKQFPNLNELCLGNNYNPNAVSVINRFKHLKRLRFDLSEYERNDKKVKLNTKFVNDLLSLNELESIDFGHIAQKRLPILLKLIQNALMIHKKKKLKIFIYCNGDYDDSVGDNIHIDLEVFVNSLEFLISQDFMFVFCAVNIPSSQDRKIKQWLNRLDEKRFWWIHDDLNSGYVKIANRGCTLNTCAREWIMECGNCKNSYFIS